MARPPIEVYILYFYFLAVFMFFLLNPNHVSCVQNMSGLLLVLVLLLLMVHLRDFVNVGLWHSIEGC